MEATLSVYRPRHLDTEAMTRIFQAQVLQMLVREHRLSADFAARLRAWRHSRFQVYRGESVESDDLPALQRLCAYIGRALFASTRVRYHPQTGNVSYRTAKGARLDLDALQWSIPCSVPTAGPKCASSPSSTTRR